MEKDSHELDKNILANKKFGDFFSEGLLLFGRNYVKIILNQVMRTSIVKSQRERRQ